MACKMLKVILGLIVIVVARIIYKLLSKLHCIHKKLLIGALHVLSESLVHMSWTTTIVRIKKISASYCII